MGNQKDFNTVRDMEIGWKEPIFIGVSPTITIGMSFDIPNHFFCTMINFKPTCVVRDLFQAHMRVRYTTSNEIFFQRPNNKYLEWAKGCYKEYERELPNLENYIMEKIDHVARDFLTFKERLHYDNPEEKESFSKKIGYMHNLLKERKNEIPDSFKRNFK